VRRLLALWLTLLAADWLTGAVVSAVVAGRVDSSSEALVRLTFLPVLQAAVVGWATRRHGPFLHLLPLRVGLRRPWLRATLAVDAAVIAAGLMLGGALGGALAGVSVLGLAEPRSLPGLWAGIKAAAAGVAFGRAAARQPDTAERVWLGLTAAGLLLLGPATLLGAFRAMPVFLPGRPLMQWLEVQGLLGVAAAGFLLRVQSALHGRQRLTALALDGAVGLGVLAALAVIAGLLFGPQPVEPWASTAAVCASLATTALLLAGGLALPDDEPDPRSDPRPPRFDPGAM
jgi:hypothetical protein